MSLEDIWKLLVGAGPFASALLLYLYLDERAERRKKDEELKKVLEQSISAIVEARMTMETWLELFKQRSNRDDNEK